MDYVGSSFFGATCFSNHLHLDDNGQETEKNTVCHMYKKCNGCGKVLRGKESKKHIYGYSTCPCCKRYLNLYTHQWFLQRIEDEEKKKKRCHKCKHGTSAGLQTLAASDPILKKTWPHLLHHCLYILTSRCVKIKESMWPIFFVWRGTISMISLCLR